VRGGLSPSDVPHLRMTAVLARHILGK